jgi:hypothetical protein
MKAREVKRSTRLAESANSLFRSERIGCGLYLDMSGGASNNVIEFKFEKIAPRTYKVQLPAVTIGEYGFLAPGAAASSDLASRGKIYTLRIVE